MRDLLRHSSHRHRAAANPRLSGGRAIRLRKETTLPKLPVPDLESTLQKYLAQVEVVAPNCLPKTRSLVRAFLAGPGPKLQQRLLERRQKVPNWIMSLARLLRHNARASTLDTT
ncbi:unnamed protein product [Xylocopa violacea]|uniref:Choline/carnitine acyltransferase domain-containing protein n=1 Tax=Xylocopa violacea TaxID=135666 RepID=A0ABP1N4R9_XYLVO